MHDPHGHGGGVNRTSQPTADRPAGQRVVQALGVLGHLRQSCNRSPPVSASSSLCAPASSLRRSPESAGLLARTGHPYGCEVHSTSQPSTSARVSKRRPAIRTASHAAPPARPRLRPAGSSGGRRSVGPRGGVGRISGVSRTIRGDVRLTPVPAGADPARRPHGHPPRLRPSTAPALFGWPQEPHGHDAGLNRAPRRAAWSTQDLHGTLLGSTEQPVNPPRTATQSWRAPGSARHAAGVNRTRGSPHPRSVRSAPGSARAQRWGQPNTPRTRPEPPPAQVSLRIRMGTALAPTEHPALPQHRTPAPRASAGSCPSDRTVEHRLP